MQDKEQDPAILVLLRDTLRGGFLMEKAVDSLWRGSREGEDRGSGMAPTQLTGRLALSPSLLPRRFGHLGLLG